MLLDLWEWFLLINDGIDLVFSNLASGTYPIPLSFLLVFFLFGLISFFAWRSTDIPDLPPAPRPPYVIQITAGPGSGGLRQTIADVRLLSGGAFFDGSEILTRYQNISRNQATNTDSNAQPSTSGSASNRNAAAGTRNPLVDTSTTSQNIRRRIPGRSLLLGLFRRPNTLARPVPAVSNAIRAQLGASNLVVYHRVNAYHHHIHSHLGHNSSNVPTNPNIPSNQSQNSGVSGSSTSSSVPQSSSSSTTNAANSSPLPESSSISETSPLQENDRATHSTSDSSRNVQHASLDSGDTTVDERGSFRLVQIGVPENTLSNSSQKISNSVPSDNMPARSGGESSQHNEGGCSSTTTTTYSHHTPGTTNESSSEREDVRFTIKFLNDSQMDVTSQLSEKIVDFKRQQNQDQSRGSGLPATGRGNNENPADGIQGNVRRMVGLPEPGMFFVAFIGIFLIFLWFICLHFGQHLFTQSAVISFTVLTAIFLIGIVACYLPLPTN